MTSPRSILITGCSSGIGLCVARGLKQRGYRVFATARARADVETLHAEGFEAFQLDLADSDSIRAAVAAVLVASGGGLDALFNNGAYGQPGAVEDVRREVLREQFETNLFGTHELTNLIIPVMRRQGYGRIVQNSSVLGFAAMRYRGAYNASKYALEGLSDTLRLELKGSGIEVCLIEPGPILSRFRDNAFAMYRKHIQPEHSPHRQTYAAMETRLQKEGPAAPFTLGPEAVLGKVILALESQRPRARYYVTFPTYLFAYLKRLLPTRALDWLLGRVG
ncbi:Short-chain dehydrogenase [Methylomagnum ishizawai]|uniref:Short-chain dehydrogenase n=1 Tax=Methylomagnum ishizawai TaxID=1760988 RepID=A0A1Y6D397_9GAMM|nr:SDR family oxidoreductase [Methylomagnum ishizawai]SMF95313.1 Short-chain dehydrogenase [Methylomagnum ishizawai]